ncbi:MAG TPA: peptide chain release factor 2, partial [Synergistaceae bacterium]|nr:peptide chain release factor 2 [Synergistaceae bacterium]
MEKDTEVLQAQTVKEDFWSRDDAQEVLRKLARLQERAQQWSEVSAELEELILLSDLLGETS